MLPPQPQQQVRSLQPGGVTLSTHARKSAAALPRKAAATSASPVRSATPAVSHTRSVAAQNEPDVVTHYYKKEKPSPAHQSTVAGVQHFSDIE
jgi:hypothetical protein